MPLLLGYNSVQLRPMTLIKQKITRMATYLTRSPLIISLTQSHRWDPQPSRTREREIGRENTRSTYLHKNNLLTRSSENAAKGKLCEPGILQFLPVRYFPWLAAVSCLLACAKSFASLRFRLVAFFTSPRGTLTTGC